MEDGDSRIILTSHRVSEIGLSSLLVLVTVHPKKSVPVCFVVEETKHTKCTT